jgi:hypothetical protein
VKITLSSQSSIKRIMMIQTWKIKIQMPPERMKPQIKYLTSGRQFHHKILMPLIQKCHQVS